MKISKRKYLQSSLFIILLVIVFVYLARIFRFLFWGATGIVALIIFFAILAVLMSRNQRN